MTREEVKFQVALSCIQGILEAKHGVLGEILPALAVKESLRIADAFVEEWFNNKAKNKAWNACDDLMLHRIIECGSVLIPMGETALAADQINWLKALPERFNLQPKNKRLEKQNAWKPTEEELSDLQIAISFAEDDGMDVIAGERYLEKLKKLINA